MPHYRQRVIVDVNKFSKVLVGHNLHFLDYMLGHAFNKHCSCVPIVHIQSSQYVLLVTETRNIIFK